MVVARLFADRSFRLDRKWNATSFGGFRFAPWGVLSQLPFQVERCPFCSTSTCTEKAQNCENWRCLHAFRFGPPDCWECQRCVWYSGSLSRFEALRFGGFKLSHNWRCCPFFVKLKAFTKMPFLWSVLATCMQDEVGFFIYPSCNDLLRYLCFALKNPRLTSYRCLQVIARHQIYRVHLCSKNQLNMWKMGPEQRHNDSETRQSNMGLQILAVLRRWGDRLAFRFGSGTIRHK